MSLRFGRGDYYVPSEAGEDEHRYRAREHFLDVLADEVPKAIEEFHDRVEPHLRALLEVRADPEASQRLLEGSGHAESWRREGGTPDALPRGWPTYARWVGGLLPLAAPAEHWYRMVWILGSTLEETLDAWSEEYRLQENRWAAGHLLARAWLGAWQFSLSDAPGDLAGGDEYRSFIPAAGASEEGLEVGAELSISPAFPSPWPGVRFTDVLAEFFNRATPAGPPGFVSEMEIHFPALPHVEGTNMANHGLADWAPASEEFRDWQERAERLFHQALDEYKARVEADAARRGLKRTQSKRFAKRDFRLLVQFQVLGETQDKLRPKGKDVKAVQKAIARTAKLVGLRLRDPL